MSLRERNAERTRELILDTALPLFLKQGYDATTMEEIAEQAEIGTSTLYRYFPTKDALIMEPLAVRGYLAEGLRACPPDEPLEFALWQAIETFLKAPRGNPARLRQIEKVLKGTTSLQVRLLGDFIEERTLFEQALAERLRRPADDIFVVVTARIATVVLELATARGQKDSHSGLPNDLPSPDKVIARAHEVLAQLHKEPPTLPR